MIALLLVVIFVVAPLAELAVLVQVADGIGIGNTILLLIGVSIVGIWLCKREGLGVLRRIRESLEQHELPTKELADGFLILLAGALLIAPGFISDVLGILLLLPPTRAVFRALLLAAFARRTVVTLVTGGRGGGGSSRGVIDTSSHE